MSKRKADSAHEVPAGREAKKRHRDSEESLLAQMPLIRRRTKRLLDGPVHKASFWDARDRKSWHLRYPEMTQLQLDAFMLGAEARREKFVPGRTPLWQLAMKYFPPSQPQQQQQQQQQQSTPPKQCNAAASSESTSGSKKPSVAASEQGLPSPVDESNPSRPEAGAVPRDMSPPARPPSLQDLQKLADDEWELRRDRSLDEERKRSRDFRDRQIDARARKKEAGEVSSLSSSPDRPSSQLSNKRQ